MKEVWISYCTEYEQGWGQRPDGYAVGINEQVILDYIKTKGNGGSYECYWRYDTPQKVFCDDVVYQLIIDRTNDERKVSFFDNNEKLKLYKEI